MAAFSHSTPDTRFREGSSLQAGLYARTPVQSDCCAFPVTINLSPTRKDTTNRHWQQPLVTGCARDVVRVLEVVPYYGYTGRTDLVTASRTSQLPRFRSCQLTEPSKNHLAGWFFRLQSKRLRRNDRISRRSKKKNIAFIPQNKVPVMKLLFADNLYFEKNHAIV
jgi:hypothetical protein